MLDIVAERLRRWTANPLGSPRVGSNPIDVVRDIMRKEPMPIQYFLPVPRLLLVLCRPVVPAATPILTNIYSGGMMPYLRCPWHVVNVNAFWQSLSADTYQHQQIELRLYAIMFFSIDYTRLCTIISDYTRLFYYKNSNDYTRLFHYLTKDDYFTYFTKIISLIFFGTYYCDYCDYKRLCALF